MYLFMINTHRTPIHLGAEVIMEDMNIAVSRLETGTQPILSTANYIRNLLAHNTYKETIVSIANHGRLLFVGEAIYFLRAVANYYNVH